MTAEPRCGHGHRYSRFDGGSHLHPLVGWTFCDEGPETLCGDVSVDGGGPCVLPEDHAVHDDGAGCHWAEPWFDAVPAALRSAHPESYCHRCAGRNVQWSAPSPLWNAVMRPDGERAAQWEEIVCPSCFAELAGLAGIASSFRLDATDAVDLPTHSPDGRVWDSARWLWVAAGVVREPGTESDRTTPSTSPAPGEQGSRDG